MPLGLIRWFSCIRGTLQNGLLLKKFDIEIILLYLRKLMQKCF